MKFIIVIFFAEIVIACDNKIKLYQDYFLYKNVKHVSYFSCENQTKNIIVVKALSQVNMRCSVIQTDYNEEPSLEKVSSQSRTMVGFLVDGTCESTAAILDLASKSKIFSATYAWLITTPERNSATDFIQQHFQNLNLSIDADFAIASNYESGYTLTDVFNFGKTRGGGLQIASLGSWRSDTGLNIFQTEYKYYYRGNFQNLTLRAISVISGKPKKFVPELLSVISYTPGVSATTKITSQLLNLLKEHHNFRFNYTITDRWIGSPQRNSNLAVTNSLFREEQDISSSCTTVSPHLTNWVDICLSPITNLQTKFYYLLLDQSVGDYENRFLSPLSVRAWCGAGGAAIACAVALAAGAALEHRTRPILHAAFTVTAALFQQDFDDGDKKIRTSQGRRLALVVAGATSFLLYNYYTSSAVTHQLRAPPAALQSVSRLTTSHLELVFQDVDYTRTWIYNPGVYYYNGFVDPAEDSLREVKVSKARRTVAILQPVHVGMELVKTGAYAFHSEPYPALHEVTRSFSEQELCALQELQLMKPAPAYLVLQRNSPYKEFFGWSFLRISERGLASASRRRFTGAAPACSRRATRAVTLGQAAPAFVVLLIMMMISVVVLLAERAWYRFHPGGNAHGNQRQFRQQGGSPSVRLGDKRAVRAKTGLLP